MQISMPMFILISFASLLLLYSVSFSFYTLSLTSIITTISRHCAISSACQWYWRYTSDTLLSVSPHIHRCTPLTLVFIFFIFFKLFMIRYCLVAIAIMILGVIFWAVWRVVLPKIFRYELVPKKVVLKEGTVVVVVNSFLFYNFFWMFS